MLKKIAQRGFTLIELLVVIAIIGILASVVLASLNTARAKGSDAAIRSSINSMRAQAELFSDNNNYTYRTIVSGADFARAACPVTPVAGTLFSDPVIIKALVSVTAQAKNAACYSSVSAWAIAAELKTSDNSGPNVDTYCVDSTGAAKFKTDTPGSINAMNSSGVCLD